MAVLKELVQNILIFYIILSVVMALIGNSSFKKYIQMFSGLVMIIIILNPLMKLLGVENTLNLQLKKNQLFEISQAESEDIMVAEMKQSDAVMQQYEETISQQIQSVMNHYDFYATNVQVSIDDSLDSDTFGQVQKIEISCQKGTSSECMEEVQETETIKQVAIPDIKIETKEEIEKEVTDTLQTKEVMLEIANMYGLGMEQIQIQVEEETDNE